MHWLTDTTISVALGARSYDVMIGDGMLDRAGMPIAPLLRRPWVPVVTDASIADTHGQRLAASLSAAGIAHATLVLDPGEATKSWAGLARLTEWLIEQGIERTDHVIALGGGVIGDLVGFASSIAKRGCSFIQVPTTLLSQVDSSVGGKTAINTERGKNMVGTFHQPARVLIDPGTLATLPARQLRAGYAEVAKYGLINQPAFFQWCEGHAAALLAGNAAARQRAIATSIEAKAGIVAADERETSGVRALLNLGHTFGHALEAETGYSDRLLHGEAVAAGMGLAFAFSAARGHCAADDARRVAAHLAAVGLPFDLQSAGISASGAALAAHMMHDKKASGGTVAFILARGIGEAYVERGVRLEEVAAWLDTLPRA